MRESEFRKIQSEVESRERGLERLEADPGDPVIYDGETWLLLEITDGRRGPVAHLEQWDKMERANPAFVEAKE